MPVGRFSFSAVGSLIFIPPDVSDRGELQTLSEVEYKGAECVFLCACDEQQSGLFGPSGPHATAAPAPSPTPRGSAVTFALVALAGVCTYINVICINVIGALFPLQGLEPDTGVIIWKRGREEEPGIELIILTRASGEERGGVERKQGVTYGDRGVLA